MLKLHCEKPMTEQAKHNEYIITSSLLNAAVNSNNREIQELCLKQLGKMLEIVEGEKNSPLKQKAPQSRLHQAKALFVRFKKKFSLTVSRSSHSEEQKL